MNSFEQGGANTGSALLGKDSTKRRRKSPTFDSGSPENPFQQMPTQEIADLRRAIHADIPKPAKTPDELRLEALHAEQERIKRLMPKKDPDPAYFGALADVENEIEKTEHPSSIRAWLRHLADTFKK